MPAGEMVETFRLIGAMAQIGTQKRFHLPRRIFGTKPAAHMNVVALDLIVLTGSDFGGKQADVANVVLCAGMMAARDVDVDGLIHRQSRVHMIGDAKRIALGVGSGEFATCVPCASHQTGSDRRSAPMEPASFDVGVCIIELGIGDAGDDEILPDREADVAITAFPRLGGENAHLGGCHLANRQGNANPVQPGLALRVHSHMSEPVVARPLFHQRVIDAHQLRAEFFFDGRDELIETPAVEEHI